MDNSLNTLFNFPKKKGDKKIYIDGRLYIQFGNGLHKYIGLYEVVKEYKTIWKAYLRRLTHEEWKDLYEQGRIKKI